MRLGLLLVLLAPCTDWFITFTQLGRGDAARATALTPLTLVLQLALLPLYLWWITDLDLLRVFSLAEVWPAILVVAVPLALATAFELVGRKRPGAVRARRWFGTLPAPLLAAVILLVAVSHASAVGESLGLLAIVAAIAAAYLAAALALAKFVAAGTRLPVQQGRTLAFSLGTRNSFIVLPFALSLPSGWEIAAVAVVIQSLVELFGMALAVWFVPRVLFRERGAQESPRYSNSG